MLGLVVIKADIGVDEQYELGMYVCRFSEDVPLAASSQKQYIHSNVKVSAIMLHLTKANKQFPVKYYVIYSDWDMVTKICLTYRMICFRSNLPSKIHKCNLNTVQTILLMGSDCQRILHFILVRIDYVLSYHSIALLGIVVIYPKFPGNALFPDMAVRYLLPLGSPPMALLSLASLPWLCLAQLCLA